LGHWLLLLALVAMWGSAFLLTKVAVSALPPEAVVAGRLVIAAAGLSGLLLVMGRRLPGARRLWLFFLAMAVLGNALPFWLIAWGQQRIDSGLAGILMAVMPLTTLVLAHFFVAGERLNRARSAGFVLGFLGIVVLMGPEALLELRSGGTALLSELAVLGGAVCYAVNTIVARRRPDSDPLSAAAGVMLLACAIMVPLALAGEPLAVADIPAAAALAVAVLGVVSTALATVVYFRLVSAAGPTFVSLINYLIPLWALLGGMVFLGERPEWTALAALALILSGIALSEARGRAQSSSSVSQ
jgi:drug/metabolite transporter (DMT)-like permease